MTLEHFPAFAPSPFDTLRQVRSDGAEFWSARDLSDAMTYDQWRNFAAAIDRAKISISNQGHHPTDHIADASKMVAVGSGAYREVQDYHLTRFGAYVVVMNGDPRKSEVAAAQAYFAIKTREAEVQPPILPQSYSEALRELAATVEAKELAEQRAAELEAPAAAWNDLAAADGDLTISEAAKVLSRAGIATGPTKLHNWLEANRWIFRRAGKPLPMQTAVNAGLLTEKVGDYRHPSGERRITTQVRVTPKGLERLQELLTEQTRLAVVE